MSDPSTPNLVFFVQARVQGVLCIWQLVSALRHRLIPQEEEEEEQDAKRVPDGHGRSFGFLL